MRSLDFTTTHPLLFIDRYRLHWNILHCTLYNTEDVALALFSPHCCHSCSFDETWTHKIMIAVLYDGVAIFFLLLLCRAAYNWLSPPSPSLRWAVYNSFNISIAAHCCFHVLYFIIVCLYFSLFRAFSFNCVYTTTRTKHWEKKVTEAEAWTHTHTLAQR